MPVAATVHRAAGRSTPTAGSPPADAGRSPPGAAVAGPGHPAGRPAGLTEEFPMADKSPRHSMSKKSGKSLKEKRTERKAKVDSRSQMERLTTAADKKQ